MGIESGEEIDALVKVNSRVFIIAHHIINITLPSTFTEIGQQVFDNCSNLREVKGRLESIHSTTYFGIDKLSINDIQYKSYNYYEHVK